MSRLSTKFIVVERKKRMGEKEEEEGEIDWKSFPECEPWQGHGGECVIEGIVEHFSHANATDAGLGEGTTNFSFGPAETSNLGPFKFKWFPRATRSRWHDNKTGQRTRTRRRIILEQFLPGDGKSFSVWNVRSRKPTTNRYTVCFRSTTGKLYSKRAKGEGTQRYFILYFEVDIWI